MRLMTSGGFFSALRAPMSCGKGGKAEIQRALQSNSAVPHTRFPGKQQASQQLARPHLGRDGVEGRQGGIQCRLGCGQDA